MPGYVVASYPITDPEGYEPYVPASGPTVAAAGGEILVADFESAAIESEPGHVTVVLRFDSKDAATAWYNSPEYTAARPLRADNSEGTLVIADGFEPPA